MFIYFTDPRTPLNTSYCSVVGIQRYLRDNLSSEHHDERFIYCWVVLLSAIWPPPINSLLFSALAHSQSWQRTEKEPLRYHISHRSSLLWHQHTAASFSDAHGLDGIEYSQSECGSPHSHKLTCRTGLELNHAHTKVLDFFSCKLIIPPIILPSHTFLMSNVVQYCSVVVFYCTRTIWKINQHQYASQQLFVASSWSFVLLTSLCPRGCGIFGGDDTF